MKKGDFGLLLTWDDSTWVTFCALSKPADTNIQFKSKQRSTVPVLVSMRLLEYQVMWCLCDKKMTIVNLKQQSKIVITRSCSQFWPTTTNWTNEYYETPFNILKILPVMSDFKPNHTWKYKQMRWNGSN
jgi:hypothetical protein